MTNRIDAASPAPGGEQDLVVGEAGPRLLPQTAGQQTGQQQDYTQPSVSSHLTGSRVGSFCTRYKVPTGRVVLY